jgi:ABC-type antimicrobial peptide transport system permease subunit
MALGSDRSAILRGVFAEGGQMIVAGMAIGAAGTLILARFLSSALTEVGAFDVPTFAASALVLAGATLAAAFVPAVRATRIDPVEALRHE